MTIPREAGYRALRAEVRRLRAEPRTAGRSAEIDRELGPILGELDRRHGAYVGLLTLIGTAVAAVFAVLGWAQH